MAWSRFVAVGDSFTEGIHDGPDDGSAFTGWADRLAVALAAGDHPDLHYANLAVRGRLLGQVVDDQLPVALAMSPDLLAFHAGGNDVLRPGVDVDEVLSRYDDAVAAAVAPGRTVLLFTVLERSGPADGRLTARLANRIGRWNDGVRRSASRHGAVLVDVAPVAALSDRRLWHVDRLHLNPAGHERITAAALAALEAGPLDARPSAWWRAPLPGSASRSPLGRASDDARWVATHLAPWVLRRLRGASSGDGRTARRPDLRRVRPTD
jgi:lysophospholipase L1-like esterase